MRTYEELYEIVKQKLSEKRFRHCTGVVKRAIEYAKIYNVDIEMVKKVAIIHDIAKEFTDEENKVYIEKYNIELDHIEKLNKNLLHAKIGANICKNEYGFTDDMVNAVRFHTTGREDMSILEKIIYLADATEENKIYIPNNFIDIIKQDIDKGMVEVSRYVLTELLKDNKYIHENTIKCYNFYK